MKRRPPSGLAVPAQGDDRIPDPRGVRATLAPTSAGADLLPLVVEPPGIPVVAIPRVTGAGLLGGTAHHAPVDAAAPAGPRRVLLDGEPVEAELVRLDDERAVLVRGGGSGSRVNLMILAGAPVPGTRHGPVRHEVVVGGWRVEVDVEPAARAALRERARRGREEIGHSGPTEVHAIIPGVVVSVSVAPGDAVTAGQQLLVVEAMKMQNELRAPRDGTIERVAVGAGRTIEVGDLLLVIS